MKTRVRNNSAQGEVSELIKVGKTWFAIYGEEGAYTAYRLNRQTWQETGFFESYFAARSAILQEIAVSIVPEAKLSKYGIFSQERPRAV